MLLSVLLQWHRAYYCIRKGEVYYRTYPVVAIISVGQPSWLGFRVLGAVLICKWIRVLTFCNEGTAHTVHYAAGVSNLTL